jgi:flagellar biosynthesis protein FlhF
VRAGVYPEIVHEILTRSQIAETEVAGSLKRLVREPIKTDAWTGSNQPRIAVLIGPPGSGKTTTLAKIAAAYGVAARISTHVITTDVFRIAAADQLRTLCSILGVGCESVETPVALEHVLSEQRNKKLILIDTPGLSERDAADFECFARFLSARRDIEKHLILPASVKSEDLSRISDRYRGFGPTHLLFTKLDETSTFGCLLNETYRTGCPVSFLSRGQNIPEDLDPADSEKIADLVLGAETSGTARVSAAA